MSKRTALFITAILSLLAILAFLALKPVGSAVSTKAHREAGNGNAPHPSRLNDSDRPPQTKRSRQDEPDAKALRELEAEFDKILPAQFPDQPSSLCDATLEPGDTLVLGGFRRSDGNYEFTTLVAEPIGADGAPFQNEGAAPQYKITTKLLLMSRDKSSKIGLASLISTAQTRIQKSIVFPAGETPSLATDTHLVSMPHVVTRPDTAATMYIAQENEGHVVSMIVSPKEDGKSLRIRTRVESPSEPILPSMPTAPKN